MSFNPFAQDANRINAQQNSEVDDRTGAAAVSGSPRPGFPYVHSSGIDFSQQRDELNARANLLWGGTPRPSSFRSSENQRFSSRETSLIGVDGAAAVSGCASSRSMLDPSAARVPTDISSISSSSSRMDGNSNESDVHAQDL